MNTNHKLIYNNSENMEYIKDETIDLVVTSPPYPMIEMWDELFSNDNTVKNALNNYDGNTAFEYMNQRLDRVWSELYRVVKNGGIVCINIGDATRTINGNFKIYNNHARIINSFDKLGFSPLPLILWRKQTNAPNKFMGSGMLPCGAYVTLEHEYILIFRKNSKREFSTQSEKILRRESAFFWEERNVWFSDLWDFKGISQQIKHQTRSRSAAFPLELPYRLINMYSKKGDTVLDPFVGTGTTVIASMALERNSIGIEIDENFSKMINENIMISKNIMNERNLKRLSDHLIFVKNYTKPFKHKNEYYDFPVVTSQEKNLKINYVDNIKEVANNEFETTYSPIIDIVKI